MDRFKCYIIFHIAILYRYTMKYTRKRKKIRKRGGTAKETMTKGFYSTVSAIGSTATFVGKAATTTAGVVGRAGKKVVVGTVESALLLKIKPAIMKAIAAAIPQLKKQQFVVEYKIKKFCKKYPKPYCDKLIQCVEHLFKFLNDCLYSGYLLSITVWKPIVSELWNMYQLMPEVDRQQLMKELQNEDEPEMPKPKGMWGSQPFHQQFQQHSMYVAQDPHPFPPNSGESQLALDPIYGETIKSVLLKMMSQPKFKVTMLDGIITMLVNSLPAGKIANIPFLIEIANSVGSSFIFMLLKQYIDDINTLSPSVFATKDEELKKQIYDLMSMFFKMGFMIIIESQTNSITLENDIKQALNDMIEQVQTIQLGNPKELYLQQICEIIDLIDTTDTF